MTQPDWADEIVIKYMTREGLSRHGIDEAEELMAGLAKELRKAWSDGFEVGLVDGLRMSHNFERASEGHEPKSENNGGNS
jgi:hypothetical protein